MAQTIILGTKTKVLCVFVAVVLCSFSPSFGDTMVRFDTTMGNFHVQLYDSVTPETVENFLNYVNDGDYTNSFFHRLVDNFVLQGGGFAYNGANGPIEDVPTDPTVQNEYNVSNTYGTIAMAKIGGDPNSATSQFFFNLVDNSGSLDYDINNSNTNGGYTVFGEVIGNGMDVVELLAAQQVWDVSSAHGALGQLPLIDYELGGPVPWQDTMEMVYTVTVVTPGDANGDGIVSASDYSAIQINFADAGGVGIPGDANFDGIVSSLDYAAVYDNFSGNSASTTSLTPEPATMTVIAVGGLGLIRRKKRR